MPLLWHLLCQHAAFSGEYPIPLWPAPSSALAHVQSWQHEETIWLHEDISASKTQSLFRQGSKTAWKRGADRQVVNNRIYEMGSACPLVHLPAVQEVLLWALMSDT